MKIQFLPDGAVHFTRSPEALALFEGHPKRIERMTEILFDEKKQRYFIKFLKGPCVGEILAEGYPYDHPDAVPTVEGRSDGYAPDPAAMFDTYEQAVMAELRAVDKLRQSGHVMV